MPSRPASRAAATSGRAPHALRLRPEAALRLRVASDPRLPATLLYRLWGGNDDALDPELYRLVRRNPHLTPEVLRPVLTRLLARLGSPRSGEYVILPQILHLLGRAEVRTLDHVAQVLALVVRLAGGDTPNALALYTNGITPAAARALAPRLLAPITPLPRSAWRTLEPHLARGELPGALLARADAPPALLRRLARRRTLPAGLLLPLVRAGGADPAVRSALAHVTDPRVRLELLAREPDPVRQQARADDLVATAPVAVKRAILRGRWPATLPLPTRLVAHLLATAPAATRETLLRQVRRHPAAASVAPVSPP